MEGLRAHRGWEAASPGGESGSGVVRGKRAMPRSVPSVARREALEIIFADPCPTLTIMYFLKKNDDVIAGIWSDGDE